MIGSIFLRTATHTIAIGGLDLELREGDGPRWITKVVLLGDGMRVESDARLGEDEPALGAELDELVRARRAEASLASEDGAVYLSFGARSERELGLAIRLARRGGVISVLETRIARAHASDVAREMRRFPFG